MKQLAIILALATTVAFAQAEEPKKVAIGKAAPDFKIKDSTGKEINLAELTAKGPVLVRLTCGCLGCDKELPYFQELHTAYKAQGLTSLAIFREPDAKVEAYVKEKKLNMLYAVDTKGDSWKVFDTKVMPSNFLIAKGGQIVKISAGCDTSGMIAERLSEATAKLTGADKVEVKAKVDAQKPAAAKPVAKYTSVQFHSKGRRHWRPFAFPGPHANSLRSLQRQRAEEAVRPRSRRLQPALRFRPDHHIAGDSQPEGCDYGFSGHFSDSVPRRLCAV